MSKADTQKLSLNNFERMIQLAEDVFSVKNDPDQLDVNPEVRDNLIKIHPSTVSQENDGNGPIAWVLVIPTTIDLMNQFLEMKISERELFELTPLNTTYEALYLCSALVLEEHRRKGITKQLLLKAIENICKDHPLKALFVWPFSLEGDLLSESISRITALPLYKRSK
jgi:hypothetical protein